MRPHDTVCSVRFPPVTAMRPGRDALARTMSWKPPSYMVAPPPPPPPRDDGREERRRDERPRHDEQNYDRDERRYDRFDDRRGRYDEFGRDGGRLYDGRRDEFGRDSGRFDDRRDGGRFDDDRRGRDGPRDQDRRDAYEEAPYVPRYSAYAAAERRELKSSTQEAPAKRQKVDPRANTRLLQPHKRAALLSHLRLVSGSKTLAKTRRSAKRLGGCPRRTRA